MGNQCQQYFNTPENEITTGEDDYDPSIRDLKILLIKKICSKNDYLVLKPISNEEFNNQLKTAKIPTIQKNVQFYLLTIHSKYSFDKIIDFLHRSNQGSKYNIPHYKISALLNRTYS